MKSPRKTERISTEPGDPDAWVCLRGNVPAGGGFYPGDAEGNEIEPTADSDWNGLYVCADRGRIIDMRTLVVTGISSDPTFLV